jgi:diguanylate cyclase (GGDEF)-like protein
VNTLAVVVLPAIAGLLTGSALGLLTAVVVRSRLTAALTVARRAATVDILTGLANRAGWHQHTATLLNHAAATRRQLVALVVDLDRFKPVNDTHGHATGDTILRTAAARLAATVDPYGVVSRLGGDEFAALLTVPVGTDAATWSADLAARLRHTLASPVPVNGTSIRVGASIGVAVLPVGTRRDTDLSTALAHADIAMYRDKDQHRQTSGPLTLTRNAGRAA